VHRGTLDCFSDRIPRFPARTRRRASAEKCSSDHQTAIYQNCTEREDRSVIHKQHDRGSRFVLHKLKLRTLLALLPAKNECAWADCRSKVHCGYLDSFIRAKLIIINEKRECEKTAKEKRVMNILLVNLMDNPQSRQLLCDD
jgi:hypothetical protein